MTKFFAIFLAALIKAITGVFPRWKSLTMRARLFDRLQPVETVSINGKTLKLLIPNRTCVYWAKYGPGSETTTNAWIASFEKDDTFVDIGANIGLYSLLAAAHGVSKTYAIEPNPFSFSVLAHNVVTNGFSRQIAPLCLAMNNRSSLVTFKLGGLHAGNVENEIAKGEKLGEGVPLTTASFSIDELFCIQGITGINHLKIDVDGLELEILKGADKLLSDKFLKSILVEDNSGEKFEYSELFALIEKYSFKKSDEWGHDITSNQIFTRA